MTTTNLFKYPKLILVLEYLYTDGEKIINELSKKVNVQYSYISKQISFLKGLGLINNKKSGRKNIISLTKKGKEIGKRINEIGEILK